MNIEELFQKANKDTIELSTHKEKLRGFLLRDGYFDEERESWDWKVSFPSLAFAAILLIFTFSLSGRTATDTISPATAPANETFYAKMAKNKNVSPVAEGSGTNALQMVEDDTMTVFYFNDRNVLVHSEVYNNNQ